MRGGLFHSLWGLPLLVAPGALAFSAVASSSKNFDILKPNLPQDLDIVGVGGWHHLSQLANGGEKSVKEQLVEWIVQDDDSNAKDTSTLLGLVALLQAEGKGYDSALIDGEWQMVLSQSNKKKSPRIQRVFDNNKAAMNYFHVDEGTFEGDVRLLKFGHLKSFVSFKPAAENYGVVPGTNKIFLRRIQCDITGASWKFGRLPTLPLPLKRTGGWLDILYLDADVRVTRGNRGGLFVHMRPDYLKQQQQ